MNEGINYSVLAPLDPGHTRMPKTKFKRARKHCRLRALLLFIILCGKLANLGRGFIHKVSLKDSSQKKKVVSTRFAFVYFFSKSYQPKCHYKNENEFKIHKLFFGDLNGYMNSIVLMNSLNYIE